MDQQKIFPTSMRGFDKKAVLDYIYNLDVAAKQNEANLQEQISELTGLLEQSRSENAALKAQRETDRAQSEALKSAHEKFKADADKLVQIAKNKDRELQVQTELNRQLQNRNAELSEQIKSLLARLEELESMQSDSDSQAEQTLSQAREQAREILDSANRQAEQLATASAGEISLLREELTQFKEQISKKLSGFELALDALESSSHLSDPASDSAILPRNTTSSTVHSQTSAAPAAAKEIKSGRFSFFR